MSLKLIFLFLLMKGSHYETQQPVLVQIQAPFLCNCLQDEPQKRPRREHCDARRNPPVSDALLLPVERVQEPAHD